MVLNDAALHFLLNDLTLRDQAAIVSRYQVRVRRRFPMSEVLAEPVSQLLAKWRAGDEESLRRLVPLVYSELRQIAHRHLRNERPDHTLQTTALVHEAYMRFMEQQPIDLQNREHFLAVSANLMRQILVQYARRRKTLKRNGGTKITLECATIFSANESLDFLALDDALNSLAKLDAQQSKIVELRFFAGLSIEETSQVLGVSPATVKRDWTTARVWLYREIGKGPSHDTRAMAQDKR